MKKELSYAAEVERGIMTTYRKRLWNPFMRAIRDYALLQPGDRIAVCISGGKDSMLLAKLMQMLARFSEVPFENVFLVMDPGYREENRRKIEENGRKLEIPLTFFETDIFGAVEHIEKSPCYLCARMRRGHLYNRAKELGCNKIALGHHKSDVIETTLMAMLYGAQLQGMMPKLPSTNFEGMELIRPLYCVLEDDIKAWRDANGLSFVACACRFVEQRDAAADGIGDSKRQETKALIASLKKDNPLIESNIFNSIHNVKLDTFPAYTTGGKDHSFLEFYDEKKHGKTC